MAAEIRPARATDVAALCAIEEAVFETDRISRRSFLRLMRSRSASVLAAARQGGVEGYCAVLFRAGASRARLYSIAVRPGNASRGLGRRLVGAAESESMRRGASALRLEVRADNVRAIDLYERNGYRRIGVAPGYYADGATALRYEKALGTTQS